MCAGLVGTTVARRSDAGRTSWSPEEVAHRLRLDFPKDDSMRSHEAIYQALCVQGRGALRREPGRLSADWAGASGAKGAYPWTRQEVRQPRDHDFFSECPAEAEDRAVSGQWEGDLILGLCSSAIGTLVERTTRFTMLPHLSRMDAHSQPPLKNGPGAGRTRRQSCPPPSRHRSLCCQNSFADHCHMGPGRRDGATHSTSRRHRPGALDDYLWLLRQLEAEGTRTTTRWPNP